MDYSRFTVGIVAGTALQILVLDASPSFADEGGLSFWLPGINGSFAAVPGEPGWSFATIYYHTSVDAGGNIQFPRGGEVDLGIRGRGNLVAFGPTYTFEQPFLWGGQLSASLLG